MHPLGGSSARATPRAPRFYNDGRLTAAIPPAMDPPSTAFVPIAVGWLPPRPGLDHRWVGRAGPRPRGTVDPAPEAWCIPREGRPPGRPFERLGLATTVARSAMTRLPCKHDLRNRSAGVMGGPCVRSCHSLQGLAPSSRNSEAGLTAITSRRSRARVQAI